MPLQIRATRIPEMRRPMVGKGEVMVGDKQRKGLREISNISSQVTKKVADLKISGPSSQGPVICKVAGISSRPKPALPRPANRENHLEKKQEAHQKQLIEDIDKLHSSNVFLVSEYAKDVYLYLMSLEVKLAISKWPLPSSKITEGMRTILVDWLVEVHLDLNLLQETLHTTVAILDRYLQVENMLEKHVFQLVGISALILASKYEEIISPDMEDLLYLCKNTYDRTQLVDMEKKMLKSLNFDLGRPVSVVFLRRFNMAAKADKLQHCYSKYFVDSVLLDSHFCHIRPSLVAAAAAFIAMCIIHKCHNPSLWTETMVYYTSYPFSEVRPVASQMSGFLIKSYKSPYDSVRRKYADPSFLGVSIKTQLSLELLKNIAVSSNIVSSSLASAIKTK